MKGIVFIAVVSLGIILGLGSSYSGPVFNSIADKAELKKGVKEITYDEFLEIRNSGEEYVLLNVLSAESFAEGHIEGSESFPLGDINAESVTERLSKDSNVIVHCGSFKCMASTESAIMLSDLGYNVIDYKGGLMEWEQKGNQLVK